MKSGVIMSEIQRLRPHYQTQSMLDHGRRQMLDHFEKFLQSQGAHSPTSVHPTVIAAQITGALDEIRRVAISLDDEFFVDRLSKLCDEIEDKLFGARHAS